MEIFRSSPIADQNPVRSLTLHQLEVPFLLRFLDTGSSQEYGNIRSHGPNLLQRSSIPPHILIIQIQSLDAAPEAGFDLFFTPA